MCVYMRLSVWTMSKWSIPDNVEKSASSTNWVQIFKRNNTIIIVQFGTHDFFSKCLPIVTMIMVERAWRLCYGDFYVLAPFNSLDSPWLSLPLSRYSIVLKAMHLTWTPNLSKPQAKTLFLGWVTNGVCIQIQLAICSVKLNLKCGIRGFDHWNGCHHWNFSLSLQLHLNKVVVWFITMWHSKRKKLSCKSLHLQYSLSSKIKWFNLTQ